ncbi:hypothetical protein GYMLUDRAFT_252711 [Collybiopsis luxurians FD-317 M1]|uniref:Uncharacterized protein n=1 Tax=Collybiopsis luxurians FD-317 M1 TaxID=944289 RepID=A0A0D0AKH8_9AGAR|nr:hypothetical protein GYMLUDRAFT_252711 [Collybiopsis luxurians FD-317 M1]
MKISDEQYEWLLNWYQNTAANELLKELSFSHVVHEPKANTHRDTGDFPSQNAPSIPEVVHQEDAALYAKLKDLYDLWLPKETPRGPRDDGTPSQNQSTIQGRRRTPSPQRPSCHCNNLDSTPSPNQSTIHCNKRTPSPQRPSYHRDNCDSMPSRNLSTSQGRRQTPNPQYLSNHHNNQVQVNLSSSSSLLSSSSFPRPPRLQRKQSRDARDDSDKGYSFLSNVSHKTLRGPRAGLIFFLRDYASSKQASFQKESSTVLKRIKQLGMLKRIRRKSVSTMAPSQQPPSRSHSHSRSKSALVSICSKKSAAPPPLPPTLTSELLLSQFTDGGSLETHTKRIMEEQALEATHENGGFWRDEGEKLEQEALLPPASPKTPSSTVEIHLIPGADARCRSSIGGGLTAHPACVEFPSVRDYNGVPIMGMESPSWGWGPHHGDGDAVMVENVKVDEGDSSHLGTALLGGHAQ